MTVEITSKNISKFTKRLHKALQKTLGDNAPSLLQSAELLAQAAGFKTLHDLQTHFSVQPIGLNTSFEERWVEQIENKIINYMKTHPDSQIIEWTWANFDNLTVSLNIQSKDGGFGMYFMNDNTFNETDIANYLLNPTNNDILFIQEIGNFFNSTTQKEQVMLNFHVKTSKSISIDEFYSIAKHLNFKKQHVFSEDNLGWLVEDFVVVEKDELNGLPYIKHGNKWVDLNQIKTVKEFSMFETAVSYVLKNPSLVLMQRATNEQNQTVSSFFGIPNETSHAVELKSVNGDKHFLNAQNNSDLERFRGFLARIYQDSIRNNPHAVNTQEWQLWRNGFEHFAKQKTEKTFSINPTKNTL